LQTLTQEIDVRKIFGSQGFLESEDFTGYEKNCKGIWMCECQLAQDDFQNPWKCKGFLIAFTEDFFGVAFLLDPMFGSVSAFKRVRHF